MLILITENQLHEWVRGNAEAAQGVIVELIWRLVAASSFSYTEGCRLLMCYSESEN